MCSVTFGPDGTCYSGGATGTVYVWKGRQLGKTFQVGNGMINGITVTDSQVVVGADNTIAVYDTSYNKVTEYPTTNPARAVDIKDGNIVAGLRDGTIIEIDQSGNQKTIMYSHSDGETWGLALDQSDVVVTCGDDNKIIAWDPNTRKSVGNTIVNAQAGEKAKILGASTLSVFPPNQCARAVAINPKSGHVAIGVNNGEVHIHESVKNLSKVISNLTDSAEWVECMAYSPDGKKFAVGSHDNRIYIYDVRNFVYLFIIIVFQLSIAR
jgi:WD40 repeat protein